MIYLMTSNLLSPLDLEPKARYCVAEGNGITPLYWTEEMPPASEFFDGDCLYDSQADVVLLPREHLWVQWT